MPPAAEPLFVRCSADINTPPPFPFNLPPTPVPAVEQPVTLPKAWTIWSTFYFIMSAFLSIFGLVQCSADIKTPPPFPVNLPPTPFPAVEPPAVLAKAWTIWSTFYFMMRGFHSIFGQQAAIPGRRVVRETNKQPDAEERLSVPDPINDQRGKSFFGLGDNIDGQLGSKTERPETARFKAIFQDGDPKAPRFVKIACCGIHAVAIDEQGRLWSWGSSDFTGISPPSGESLPAPIHLPGQVKFVDVICTEAATAALDAQGRVWSWGTFRDREGKKHFDDECFHQPVPKRVRFLWGKPVVSLAAGESHFVALTDRRKVYTWGIGDSGQLGRPETSPGDYLDPLLPLRLPAGFRADAVRALGFSTFILGTWRGSPAVTPTILCCGDNSYGELGLGDVDRRADLCESTSIRGKRIVDIQGGLRHALFLDEEGIVWAAGKNTAGQLGLPQTSANSDTLVRVPDVPRIAKIGGCAGGEMSYLISHEDSMLYVMGDNASGQLSNQCPVGEPQFGAKALSLKSRKAVAATGGCQWTIITTTGREEEDG
ncbi:regulator of chromosome condensation 1/beta-lactamase-inhibitor protein II [Zopfochytrium polystomum]|nr:regulator of chromosome condensation 1/beta-lactamase-inhibitor protein II [Zopfochytrium polystomum]